MTFLERSAPFLTLVLIALTAAVGALCARMECRLAARKRITLANYKQKNYLFYITNDPLPVVFAAAAALLSLVFSIIYLCHPVVRLYAVATLLLLPVDAAVVWLSLTRGKCARNIVLFDSYYVQVENRLAQKTRTQEDIRVCRARVSDLRGKLQNTVADFNRNLAQGINGDFLTELFEPVDDMIAAYDRDLEAFSANIEEEFDRALALFLKENVQPELQILPLRAFDEIAVGDMLSDIKTSYGGRVASMVMERIERGAVNNAKALGNVMSLLHSLDVRLDTETLARYIESAARFGDRAKLMRQLYQNKQVPVSLVREKFIKADMTWTFTDGMVSCFHRRELVLIFSDLLAANRVAMCYRLLAQLEPGHLAVIDEVLAANETQNETRKQMEVYRLLLSCTYAVGNSANLYENLAWMLYERRAQLPLTAAERSEVEGIVAGHSYQKEKKQIAALYERMEMQGKALVASATRVLLQYLSKAPLPALLSPARLASLLSEYRVTLSFEELRVMRDLLIGLLLITVNEDAIVRQLCGEYQIASDAVPRGEGIAPAVFGSEILERLTTKDAACLHIVLYRTEETRCALDEILQLQRRGKEMA